MDKEQLPNIGITIGDINGIGPEIIIKALENNKINRICNPIIYGSSKHLSKYKNLLKKDKWFFQTITDPRKASPNKISLINCWDQDYFDIKIGELENKAGQLAFNALKRATDDLKAGKIDAMVTAPISKDNIQSNDFKFPGHTEFLAHEFNADDVLMFMISEQVRVGVVTGHIPLETVKKNLTKKEILKKLKLMNASLIQDFSIQKPKIAVLGLNPHAGENGLLGKEEEEVIMPAINEMKRQGTIVMGPYPSDGFFAKGEYKKFDGVLAMYHDQGLIPFKMLAQEDGVNFTAGIAGVRTSPDHGTAFGIAGQNIAKESSFRHALYAAIDIAKRRKENIELEANSIKHQKIELKGVKKERN